MSEISKDTISKSINKLESLSQEPALEFSASQLKLLNQELAFDMAKINNKAVLDDTLKPQFLNLKNQLAKLKKLDSKDTQAIETAKRQYFAELVEQLFQKDNALRSPESQELEEKEGQSFNFWPKNFEVTLLLNELHSHPKEAKTLLAGKNSDILMQTALALYLDSWSRYFSEDFEYASCFKGQNKYLINSCLPIVNNQMYIPEVRLNARAVTYDLQTKNQTRRFIPSHIPGLKLPLIALVDGIRLKFALGNTSLGNFTGDRL